MKRSVLGDHNAKGVSQDDREPCKKKFAGAPNCLSRYANSVLEEIRIAPNGNDETMHGRILNEIDFVREQLALGASDVPPGKIEEIARIATVVRLVYKENPDKIGVSVLVNVFYCLCVNAYRVHNAKLYRYNNGSWDMSAVGIDSATVERVKGQLDIVEGAFLRMGGRTGFPTNRCWPDVLSALRGIFIDKTFAEITEFVVCNQDHIAKNYNNLTRAKREASWAELQAFAIQGMNKDLTDKLNNESFLKTFCHWANSDQPDSVGISSADSYICITPEGAVRSNEEKSPSNNCYLGLPYALKGTIPAGDPERLLNFIASTFIRNEGLLLLHLSLQRIALAGECPEKMLFLEDDGETGKSRLSTLFANVWGGHFRYADASIFQSDEEFRKSCDRLLGCKFACVQEIREDGHLKVDVWKRAITDERIAIRPNHGKETFMLRFGKCFWLWELNKTPVISGNADIQRCVARRAVVGKLQIKLTSKKEEVDVDKGVFLIDTELGCFLGKASTAAIYWLYVFLPFCRENSLSDCRCYVRDPAILDSKFGSTIEEDTESFVRRMFDSANPLRGSRRVPGKREDEAWALHEKLIRAQTLRLTQSFIIKCTEIPCARTMRFGRFTEYVSCAAGLFEQQPETRKGVAV